MKKSAAFLLSVLCVSTAAAAQSDFPYKDDGSGDYYKQDHKSTAPHDENHEQELVKPVPLPFIYLGPSFMPDGYASLAYRVEGGLDLESKYAIAIASAAYDDGHKTNDNDQPNPNGHDRYLAGRVYYRLPRGWFAGMGWRWSQLSTTNYTKGGNRPTIGGGHDFFYQRPCEGCRLSMRITLDWIMAGTDWQNGSHGPDIGFTFPRPSEKRHWFFRGDIAVFRSYTTVTEPQNLSLTQWQRSQRSFNGSSDMGVMYRF